jgi:hypothetical protein
MWSLVQQGLREALESDSRVAARASELEREVQALEITPASAARELLKAFLDGQRRI